MLSSFGRDRQGKPHTSKPGRPPSKGGQEDIKSSVGRSAWLLGLFDGGKEALSSQQSLSGEPLQEEDREARLGGKGDLQGSKIGGPGPH